jgi:predicted enzyme related to lactoylglutathione lyase
MGGNSPTCTINREESVARVTGIGGIFFKSRQAKELRRWYDEQLGVEPEDYGGHAFPWRQLDDPNRVGSTVWAVFPDDSTYFDPSGAGFMVNFRVDDLDEVLQRLCSAGVTVDDKIEEYEYGRFGWCFDPDGNKIELWEPLGEEGQ